jgi:hypothetical protein
MARSISPAPYRCLLPPRGGCAARAAGMQAAADRCHFAANALLSDSLPAAAAAPPAPGERTGAHDLPASGPPARHYVAKCGACGDVLRMLT